MRIATTEQMKSIDKAAIEEHSIREIVLMEMPYSFAQAAIDLLNRIHGKSVFIAAGTETTAGMRLSLPGIC